MQYSYPNNNISKIITIGLTWVPFLILINNHFHICIGLNDLIAVILGLVINIIK